MIRIEFWTTQAYIDFTARLFAQRLKPYIGKMHLPENAGGITAAINDEWDKLWPIIREHVPDGTKIPVAVQVPPCLDNIELHLTI